MAFLAGVCRATDCWADRIADLLIGQWTLTGAVED
tara:strand:- start:12 stop:116 length:105 start_codon:yes stop_codon:yes gene_type:complete